MQQWFSAWPALEPNCQAKANTASICCSAISRVHVCRDQAGVRCGTVCAYLTASGEGVRRWAMAKTDGSRKPRLRSQLWFDNPDNPGMTALYLERYLNYG